MIYVPQSIEETEKLRQWIEPRIPGVDIGSDSVCLAVIRSGAIAAVAAFYNYRKVDIELSFAADTPRWASTETITFILSFPFIQLGTQRCTAMVRKSNKRCRKLLTGVGFKEEGRHAHAGPNLETIFSYGLTRQEFMKRYGQKIAA